MPDDVQGTSPKEIHVLVDGKPTTLSLTSDGDIRSSSSSRTLPLQPTPVYNVLWAETNGEDLELSYVKRREKGKQSLLAHASWKLDVADKDAAKGWCEAVMAAAYNGVERKRRLRILVNPHGGPGKAKHTYVKTVEPIFKAARCLFETTFTERAKHASDLAKDLSLDFDALVLLSGDGLLHEVYNGFAEHDDPLKAFAIPLAPIPTGSANGMAINLLGLEDGFDVGMACLNAIKGKPMKQDICSVTLGDKRVFSFFSVALGLMADLDLGTEHLRWMGDLRFMVGYLYGLIKLKPCPITLEVKTVESDKDRMVEEFRTRAEEHRRAQHAQELDAHKHEVGADSLPVRKHTEAPGEQTDEGWIKFDKPLIYLYAGSSPYVGRDLMQFPMAHASDGLIDIAVQELTSRGELLKAIDGADKGTPFWMDSQHYFKASAYRVTPHTTAANLSIDGERYPLQPFTVECHRALGALLSPTGQYTAPFDVPRPVKKEKEKTRAQDGQAEDGEERKKGFRKLVCC